MSEVDIIWALKMIGSILGCLALAIIASSVLLKIHWNVWWPTDDME
jgi:hypothetical protein